MTDTNKINREICTGLAEVCKRLACLDDTLPGQMKQFLKFAKTFKKFSKIKQKIKKELK